MAVLGLPRRPRCGADASNVKKRRSPTFRLFLASLPITRLGTPCCPGIWLISSRRHPHGCLNKTRPTHHAHTPHPGWVGCERAEPAWSTWLAEAELQDMNSRQPHTSQGMALGYGGNPYGPAGTGKTESVKALGQAFARQVLVFNCDEQFDFKSMGRIFVGLVKCGAWGCFDEFNRLDEEVLSAVSQQIQQIQGALRDGAKTMGFMDKARA
eukprot:142636-Chlamydomonas_euryale.AAC.4